MGKSLIHRISVLCFTIICDTIRTSNEIRFSLYSYISRLNNRQKVSNPCLITLWTAGREVTMCELLDKYEAKGITNGRVEDSKNLMETMQWSAEQAMLALKISDGDKKKYLARL